MNIEMERRGLTMMKVNEGNKTIEKIEKDKSKKGRRKEKIGWSSKE